MGVHGPVFDGPTDFKRLMAGVGFLTNTSAVAVFPVPPFVEVTVTELVFKPVVVPVTLTEKVQVSPPVRVAPARLIVLEPGVAVIVPPPQEPDIPFGLATTKPPGRLSVKLTPVSDVLVLGLLMEKVRAVLLPVKIGFAVKAFAITGGSITVSAEVPIPVGVVLGPVAVEATLVVTFV